MDHETKLACLKMSIGGLGGLVSCLTLNEWVALITLFYLGLQIGLLVPKYILLIRRLMDGKSIDEGRDG